VIIKNGSKLDAITQSNKKEQDMNDMFDRIRNKDFTKSTFDPSDMTTSHRLNKFAVFVKENYNSIKRDNKLNSHKDVMQELSKHFKQLSTK